MKNKMLTALMALVCLALVLGFWYTESSREAGRALTAAEAAAALPGAVALVLFAGGAFFLLIVALLVVIGLTPTQYERNEQERFDADFPERDGGA